MKQVKKQYKHGIKFDSKLELFFYELLKKEKLGFEFQVPYTLVPSFKYNKSSIRPMNLIVDFDFTKHGRNVYQREDNKLKWKWFKYIMKDRQPLIFLPKSQKECIELVKILKKL